MRIERLQYGFVTHYDNHPLVEKTIVEWGHSHTSDENDPNSLAEFIDSVVERYEKGLPHTDKSNAYVHMKTGEVFCVTHFDKTESLGSYQCQYGLPVSWDGTMLFVQSWEKGLYA